MSCSHRLWRLLIAAIVTVACSIVFMQPSSAATANSACFADGTQTLADQTTDRNGISPEVSVVFLSTHDCVADITLGLDSSLLISGDTILLFLNTDNNTQTGDTAFKGADAEIFLAPVSSGRIAALWAPYLNGRSGPTSDLAVTVDSPLAITLHDVPLSAIGIRPDSPFVLDGAATYKSTVTGNFYVDRFGPWPVTLRAAPVAPPVVVPPVPVKPTTARKCQGGSILKGFSGSIGHVHFCASGNSKQATLALQASFTAPAHTRYFLCWRVGERRADVCDDQYTGKAGLTKVNTTHTVKGYPGIYFAIYIDVYVPGHKASYDGLASALRLP